MAEQSSINQEWGNSSPHSFLGSESPHDPEQFDDHAPPPARSDHQPKIRHQETVDPRVVPNIIGRRHQGLKDMAAEVLEQTGTSVFIKYIRPEHLAWGFFGVNSHSRAAIQMACRLIHQEESKYIAAIEAGELHPRIPEIPVGRRQQHRGDRRQGGDRRHSGERRHGGDRMHGGERRDGGERRSGGGGDR